MSFSSEVKQELYKVLPEARHCQIAEIAAILLMEGDFSPDGKSLSIRTESELLARKVFTLLKKAFKIDIDFSEGNENSSGKKGVYKLLVRDPGDTDQIRRAVGHPLLLSMECCGRSFLRGAFLAAGSISAPEKYYHFEIVCRSRTGAEMIRETMQKFNLDAKIVERKKNCVIYLKEGEQIVLVLGEMGANLSLMNLENVRIVREVRGAINRRVNCEAANLSKTIVSSVRQMEDIKFIRDTAGFHELSPALREMAETRLKHPDANLQELGTYLNPRIGKSGVNHRLRKLGEIASELRKGGED